MSPNFPTEYLVLSYIALSNKQHLAEEMTSTTSAYLSRSNDNTLSTLFRNVPTGEQLLHYRRPCTPPPKANASDPYDDGQSVLATLLMNFDNSMKLIVEIDQIAQPLVIPMSLACQPCGYAWNAMVMSACLWANKAALLNLGLNRATLELGWCSMSLAAMLPDGGIGAYAATNAKRTALANCQWQCYRT